VDGPSWYENAMRVPSPKTGRRDVAVLVLLASWLAPWGCSGPGAGNSGGSPQDGATPAADSNAAADSGGGADAATGIAEAGGSTGDSGGTREAAGSNPGADGGTDAASTLGLVPPIMRGNLYELQFGNTTFVVDGMQGARITAFTLDGTNILTGPAVNALFWGSTFWTAPESDWQTNPAGVVAAIDSAPYTMSVGTDSSITAQGGVATFKGKQVAVTKHFAADLTNGSVVIDYSMTNKGTAAIMLGHWEVTRVPPGGLTFYPAGAVAPTVAYGPIVLQKVGAYLWFDHTTFPMGTAAKSIGYEMGADAGGASADWFAHVMPDPAGDIVLIKAFPNIAQGAAGPGAGEVQIFAAANKSYVELEDNNQLLSIAPAQTVSWQVRWYLRRLPVGTMRTAGNQAIVDFVVKQMH
jgi:hypothetical protein